MGSRGTTPVHRPGLIARCASSRIGVSRAGRGPLRYRLGMPPPASLPSGSAPGRFRIEGADGVRTCLASGGWREGGDDLLWLDHVPSRLWWRRLRTGSRLNQLPGVDVLLEPEAREGWRRRRAACGGTAPAALLPLHRLPEERTALDAACGGSEEVLLLRRADSTFEARWLVRPSDDLPEETTAMARPLRRSPEDLLVSCLVLVRSVVPLRADVHAEPLCRPLSERRTSASPRPCPEAVRERVWEELLHTLRVLLAGTREALLPAREGDFALLAFEFHVSPDAPPTLLDIARGEAAGREADVLRRLGLVAGDAGSAFERLWPQPEKRAALRDFGVARVEDARAAAQEMPSDLADGTWKTAPCESGSLDGLPVLYDGERRELVPLDAVGAFVWTSCREGVPPRRIIDEVSAAFGEARERVARDVWALLAAWSHRGLAGPDSHAGAPLSPVDTQHIQERGTPGETELVATLAFGRHVISLHATAAEAAALFLPALAPWACTSTAEGVASRHVSLARDDADRWRLLEPGLGPWMPAPVWIVAPLLDRLALEAAWPTPDALALRGALLTWQGRSVLLVGASADVVAEVATRAHLAGAALHAFPYVPLTSTGQLRAPFPGPLLLEERAEPNGLEQFAGWRTARPVPRAGTTPVRLLSLPASPPHEEARTPTLCFLQVDRQAEPMHAPVAPTEALTHLVQTGLPLGRTLGPAQARALVACLEGRSALRFRAPTPAALWRLLGDRLAP